VAGAPVAVTGAVVTEAAWAVGLAAAAMAEDQAEGTAEGKAVVETEAAMEGAATEVGLAAAAMVEGLVVAAKEAAAKEAAKEAVVTVVAARPRSAQRPRSARSRAPSPRQSRRGCSSARWGC
jgi:hypothetical protein